MNVLITGGFGGIGHAIVEKYQALNFNVFYPNKNELNLSDERSIDKFFSNKKAFDVLICSAGINNPTPFLEQSTDNLLETLEINLMANYKLAQKVLPMMIDNEFGRIVNISSLWSFLTVPGRAAYSISKSGLDALTRSLAIEFGEHNILVNSVLPGFVDTALTRRNLSPERLDEICSKTPVKKLVQEKYVAQLVCYLGSSDNNSITGQSMIIDGGYSISGL